jgi:hypothetical protein
MFSLVPRIPARQFPTTGTAQTSAILVRCEVASMRPHGQRLAVVADVTEAEAHPPSELVRTASHGMGGR